MPSNALLVFDTETGGLDPERDALLSVGLVRWVDGEIEATKEVLVQPEGLNVGAKALEINKIDLKDHKKYALTRRKAAEAIYHWLDAHFDFSPSDKVVVAGHNVAFDIAFTRRLFGSYWPKMILHRSVDTSAILQFLAHAGRIPQVAAEGLDKALRHFGVPVDASKRHSALVDAIATAALYTELVKLGTQRQIGLPVPSPGQRKRCPEYLLQGAR